MFNIDALFEQCMALRCEVKVQAQIIKEFKSGERYLKLQADQHRVIDEQDSNVPCRDNWRRTDTL